MYKQAATGQSERTARYMKMRISNMTGGRVGLLRCLKMYGTRSKDGTNWLQHPL